MYTRISQKASKQTQGQNNNQVSEKPRKARDGEINRGKIICKGRRRSPWKKIHGNGNGDDPYGNKCKRPIAGNELKGTCKTLAQVHVNAEEIGAKGVGGEEWRARGEGKQGEVCSVIWEPVLLRAQLNPAAYERETELEAIQQKGMRHFHWSRHTLLTLPSPQQRFFLIHNTPWQVTVVVETLHDSLLDPPRLFKCERSLEPELYFASQRSDGTPGTRLPTPPLSHSASSWAPVQSMTSSTGPERENAAWRYSTAAPVLPDSLPAGTNYPLEILQISSSNTFDGFVDFIELSFIYFFFSSSNHKDQELGQTDRQTNRRTDIWTESSGHCGVNLATGLLFSLVTKTKQGY